MLVITKQKTKMKKITLEDILQDLVDEKTIANSKINPKYAGTRTSEVDGLKLPYPSQFVELIREFWNRYGYLIDKLENTNFNYERQLEILESLERQHIFNEKRDKKATELLAEEGLQFMDAYYTFWIPKRSGGMRRIDAPNDELKIALTALKNIFEIGMNGNTYHTSAYAYVPNRSTLNAIQRHQANESHWMLKTDFSNFFGSTTKEFLVAQLKQVYPFGKLNDEDLDILKNCLNLCFLNGGLPQGTPISPLLTNIMMVPIDHRLANYFARKADEITTFEGKAEKHFFVYTRYADDMLISSKYGFRYSEVVNFINKVLNEFNAPFELKDKKTRYGSTAGQNWNLGLMLNQENNITVGHRRKKIIAASLSNFAMDYKNNKSWEVREVQVVRGNFEYLRSIEPEYADNLVKKYSAKYGIDILKVMASIIAA